MYQAKDGGRNTLRFFDPQMQAAVTARAALETDLRAAGARRVLLHYQPQVRQRRDCGRGGAGALAHPSAAWCRRRLHSLAEEPG
jgi:predicted signal transduction protein with EAL and GGDEF domain